jgi:alpha-tubulin suppressor-like RCC1 family protein
VRSTIQHKYSKIRKIACGSAHSLAVDEDGRLLSWGINNFGCLGLGNRVQNGEIQLLPTHIRICPEGMEDDENVINNNDHKKHKNYHCAQHAMKYNIRTISAGGTHSAVLLKNGSLYTWGSGHFGQLGRRNFEDSSIPKVVSLAPDKVFKSPTRRKKLKKNRGDEKKKKLSNPHRFISKKEKLLMEKQKLLDIEREKNEWKEPKFISVSLGQDHTLGLTEDGTVYTWGGNWRGQLGRITKMHHSGQGPHSKQRMLINALKANWSVQRCVGKIALKARGKTKMRDSYPKAIEFNDNENLSSKIISISAHGHSSSCLLENGIVYTWGRVAVPKHVVVETKEIIKNDCSHDGSLADRSLPIKNDLLVLPNTEYHAMEVTVTEAAVIVIYDHLNYENIKLMEFERIREENRKRLEREAWAKRVEMQKAGRRRK